MAAIFFWGAQMLYCSIPCCESYEHREYDKLLSSHHLIDQQLKRQCIGEIPRDTRPHFKQKNMFNDPLANISTEPLPS